MAPTTRRQRQKAVADQDAQESDVEEEETEEQYFFEGKQYETYVDMVAAKRERNKKMLIQSGLVAAREKLVSATTTARASQRGLQKKRKTATDAPVTMSRRKSSRLAGEAADGAFVESERSGKFTIGGTSTVQSQDENKITEEEESFFRNRINDGSALSVKAAVELAEAKWVEEDSVADACNFVRGTLAGTLVEQRSSRSPTSVTASLSSNDAFDSSLEEISLDDEAHVAKVTPNRIYSVACHPSTEHLVVGAGDKDGHVGLWNVMQHGEETNSKDGVHLFKIHTRPVSCLEWTPSGNSMLSASYDGTVRKFDVQKESFEQLFATYDDSVEWRKELGRGLDEGYNYWVQYATLDHRNASEQCFFLSTSAGTAMHVDLRVGKNRLSFHEELSEKKINTVSLHPDGHTLASAGLDCTVKLWDIRMLKNNKTGSKKAPKPLSTTMGNTLDIVTNAHKEKSRISKNVNKIRHDNHTGRWLSTFMAKWHPSKDVFVVGSMDRPRRMEVFDATGSLLRAVQGEALTAVASRCCFHPSQDNVVLVGGNSSGRVTVAY